MKNRAALIVLLVVALVAGLWIRTRTTARDDAAGSTSATASGGEVAPALAASGSASAHAFPHAIRDQAKRDELRRRLLTAAAEAEAEANARAEADRAKGSGGPARGQRDTNDVEEFGKFIAQAIREDFIPMARECAKDLVTRHPGTSGSALVAFELLGDTKIGGVVNEASVVPDKSTIKDPVFETCVRESLYGVYFDPPPAGGRATLDFPVTLFADGGIDEEVEDFHPKDKR